MFGVLILYWDVLCINTLLDFNIRRREYIYISLRYRIIRILEQCAFILWRGCFVPNCIGQSLVFDALSLSSVF